LLREAEQEQTKGALLAAFRHLLAETNYGAITVQQICVQAHVGRSTFYRHFASKADLLVALHAQVFANFADFYTTPAQWLATTPDPRLVTFLTQMEPYLRLPPLLLAQLGPDLDYLLRQIDLLLAATFLQSLQKAFPDQALQLPLPLLAHSLAGTYGLVMRNWVTSQPPLSAQALATALQRLVRAAVQAAVGDMA